LFDVFENILNKALKYNDNPLVEIKIRLSKILQEKKPYLKINPMNFGNYIRSPYNYPEIF